MYMEPESQTDGQPTDANPSNSGSNPPQPPELVEGLDYYDMSKTKYLLVFSHEHFRHRSFLDETLPRRIGTNQDVSSLKKVFTDLNFEVIVFNDLSRKDIFKTIEAFVAKDHSETSCVVVAILTNGIYGKLWAADGPYSLNMIMAKFKGGSLVLKPKVFLVQPWAAKDDLSACRGDNIDDGQRVYLDGSNRAAITVPTHGDFLVLFSSVKDYVSYRNYCGSWMIQTFCRILSQYHHRLDILHIITLVNKTIAYNYTTYNRDNPSMHLKKQTLEAIFSLTKLLKL